MTKLKIGALIILLVGIVLLYSTNCHSSLLILSEVYYDSPGTDDGYEWIELYNNSSYSIDLAGFSIGSGGNDYSVTTVQLSGVVPPYSFFLVGGPEHSDANYNPIFSQIHNFSPDLQNSGSTGDGVGLFQTTSDHITADSIPIDAVIYGPNNNNNLLDETGVPCLPDVSDAPAGASVVRTDLGGSFSIQSIPDPGNSKYLYSAPVPEPSSFFLFGIGILALLSHTLLDREKRK